MAFEPRPIIGVSSAPGTALVDQSAAVCQAADTLCQSGICTLDVRTVLPSPPVARVKPLVPTAPELGSTEKVPLANPPVAKSSEATMVPPLFSSARMPVVLLYTAWLTDSEVPRSMVSPDWKPRTRPPNCVTLSIFSVLPAVVSAKP